MSFSKRVLFAKMQLASRALTLDPAFATGSESAILDLAGRQIMPAGIGHVETMDDVVRKSEAR
jgi:hypothetical protein